MKIKLNKRVMSTLLAFVLFLSCCPVVSLASDGFAIAHEGRSVSQVTFDKHEKIEVSAENIPEGTYQWQIKVPGTDLWVNIHGQTGQTIKLSYALLGSLLDGDSAHVRCAAVSNGEEVAHTAMLCATITEKAEEKNTEVPAIVAATEVPTKVPTDAPTEAATETPTEAATDAATEAPTDASTEAATDAATEESGTPLFATFSMARSSDTPETTDETEETEATDGTEETADAEALADDAELVSITIEYIYLDKDGNAADGFDWPPYVANINVGDDYKTTVQIKTIPGYQASLVGDSDGATLSDDGKTINLNLQNVQTSVTYTVAYQLIQVQYHVRRFLQNVNNDLYTEDTQYIDDVYLGFPGDTPDTTEIYKDDKYPGFTTLFYQPDFIAADGSTVFEVYYDRNYYLINFNLDGGFGTSPIYARYETTYHAVEPTKPGHVFDHWELISGTVPADAVINANGLVAQVPNSNLTYQAKWIQKDTSYTVAYWILDENGNKTYIGSSAPILATSGEEIDGKDDLRTALFCGHVHTVSCYSYLSTQNEPSADEMVALQALGVGEPEAGYIYTLDYNGYTYYKVHCGTYWNCWWKNQGEPESMVSGSALKETTLTHNGTEYIVRKYHADFSKGGCSHVHDDDCSGNAGYLKYVPSMEITKDDGTTEIISTDKGVTVEGDGSTVVNVYYERKLYYIKFYYARSYTTEADDGTTKTVFQIPINTNGWSGSNNPLIADGNSWTEVSSKPTIQNYANTSYTEAIQDVDTDNDSVINYTYYYFVMTGRYGEDVSARWPAAALSSVSEEDSTTYTFVSWGTEYGTEYNINSTLNNGNRNIKGPYSVLDETLIKKNGSYDQSIGAYEAQSMLSYWNTASNLRNWTYEIYLEALTDSADNVINPDNKTVKTADKNNDDIDESYLLERTLTDIYSYQGNGIDGQTLINYNGYSFIARDGNTAGSYGSYTGTLQLFYTRNIRKIYYRNYDKYMGNGDGASVPYGKSLSPYGSYFDEELMNKNYPSVLEPNAYYFGGWYTTSDCLEGTEMDWSGTMPDSNLTVYAKWVPKTYDVTFYLDYEEYLNGTEYRKVEGTPHGKTMADPPGIPTHENTDYDFIRWVYEDDAGTKYSFEPTEMPVRQNLRLYAEWRSSEISEYTVYYVIGEEVDGEIAPKLDENGNKIYLTKAPTEGYAVVGSTKSVQAKPVDQLDNLENVADLNISPLWLPQTSSHSILMRSNKDDNVFEFVYITKTSVNYTVRYLDAETNQPLFEPETKTTNAAEETVFFRYKEGYVPDAIYKRLVLSANEDDNVVIFYYTKDESGENQPDQARYQVTHWIQDVDDLTKFTIYKTESPLANVGDRVTADPLTILGFTYADNVKIGDKEFTSNKDGTVTSGKDEEHKPLELNLYYTRDQAEYWVYYKNQDNENDTKMPTANNGTALVGRVIAETAPEVKGYDLISDNTQHLTISVTESLNVLTFWYKPKDTLIKYIAKCTETDVTNFGTVSRSEDFGTTIYGSTAMPTRGFYFAGWYSDESCSDDKLVHIDATYNPKTENNLTDDVFDYTFYALFKPYKLTISQKGVNATDSAVYQVSNKSTGEVVATVMLTGTNQVTIEQIPAGTYTVQEITSNWTRTYGDNPTVTQGTNTTKTSIEVEVTSGETKEVIFTHTYVGSCWLHSESRN